MATAVRVSGAALRSGGPVTGRAERAGRERGTGGLRAARAGL
ncbi:hypothetical protein [Yanshouia hominis]|nr:hypothetical protein [Yanshouia hominis]